MRQLFYRPTILPEMERVCLIGSGYCAHRRAGVSLISCICREGYAKRQNETKQFLYASTWHIVNTILFLLDDLANRVLQKGLVP